MRKRISFQSSLWDDMMAQEKVQGMAPWKAWEKAQEKARGRAPWKAWEKVPGMEKKMVQDLAH